MKFVGFLDHLLASHLLFEIDGDLNFCFLESERNGVLHFVEANDEPAVRGPVEAHLFIWISVLWEKLENCVGNFTHLQVFDEGGELFRWICLREEFGLPDFVVFILCKLFEIFAEVVEELLVEIVHLLAQRVDSFFFLGAVKLFFGRFGLRWCDRLGWGWSWQGGQGIGSRFRGCGVFQCFIEA